MSNYNAIINYMCNVNVELTLDNVKGYADKCKIPVDENLEKDVHVYKIQMQYRSAYAQLKAFPDLVTILTLTDELIDCSDYDKKKKLITELFNKAHELFPDPSSPEECLVMYDIINRLYKNKVML